MAARGPVRRHRVGAVLLVDGPGVDGGPWRNGVGLGVGVVGRDRRASASASSLTVVGWVGGGMVWWCCFALDALMT